MFRSLQYRFDRLMDPGAFVCVETHCAFGKTARVREMGPENPEAVHAPACVHDTKRFRVDKERQRHEPGDHVVVVGRPERILRQKGLMLMPVLVIVRTDKVVPRWRGIADCVEVVIAHHG